MTTISLPTVKRCIHKAVTALGVQSAAEHSVSHTQQSLSSTGWGSFKGEDQRRNSGAQVRLARQGAPLLSLEMGPDPRCDPDLDPGSYQNPVPTKP